MYHHRKVGGGPPSTANINFPSKKDFAHEGDCVGQSPVFGLVPKISWLEAFINIMYHHRKVGGGPSSPANINFPSNKDFALEGDCVGQSPVFVLVPKISWLEAFINICLLYTSPSPRDKRQSRMPSSA